MASFRVDVGDKIVGLPGEESFFGHDSRLKGLAPRDNAKAAHLVLTLDDSDPDVAALGVDVGPFIRLVHPFYYSQGDSFHYRHVNENRLEFLNFKGHACDGWPPGGIEGRFTTREISLIATDRLPKFKGKAGTQIFVGDKSPVMQNYSDLKCKVCSVGSPKLIASVPSRPTPELNIWDNDYVAVLFWFCSSCKCITTHNESD